MKTLTAARPTIRPRPARRNNTNRAWFLRDSAWDDVVWTFAPTNVLEEERPRSVRWDFMMPSGRCFTDPLYASLLETTKRLLSLMRTRALYSGLAQRPSTIAGHFIRLRHLLRWMDEEGFRRFADLDSAAVLQFRRAIAQREGHTGATVAGSTVRDHLTPLVYLHHFRDVLGDGLSVDPTRESIRLHRCDQRSGPYTPNTIAVPLVQGAVELLEHGAFDILRAREIYATAMLRAQRRGVHYSNCCLAAQKALQRISIVTPRGTQTVRSVTDFTDLVDRLYAACFVVISYLVGPRVSEVLHLRSGCVQSRPVYDLGVGSEIAVMVGTIFKHEADYYGRRHEWVVPPAAVHAISVLEALSAPHRLQTGRDDLWLRGRCRARPRGATEWQRKFTGPFRIPASGSIMYFLNRFARWLELPDYEGKPWHLTTHQGRKTFARFAALRDRSALFALAQHFGHRDAAATDRGYVGTDYALDREIHAEILEQSVSAWEHMLSAPELGGRAGSEILAKRPQFRGVRMKKDLKSYARMLVEAGLTLGVCDWGYCVFRVEYSACRGNAAGPNPVFREPSTCGRCKNFVVTTHHRPYWFDQVRRHEALLNEPVLPTQTLRIARERLEEARSMLRAIDSSTKAHAS